MLIHLSEVFTCEGKKKTVQTEIGFDSILSADKETYPIWKKNLFL